MSGAPTSNGGELGFGGGSACIDNGGSISLPSMLGYGETDMRQCKEAEARAVCPTSDDGELGYGGGTVYIDGGGSISLPGALE
jgi:hypothetical protein